MWVNKDTWNSTLERIVALEKAVVTLQKDNLITEYRSNSQLLPGTSFYRDNSKYHSVKDVLEKVLTHLGLKIETKEATEYVHLVETPLAVQKG